MKLTENKLNQLDNTTLTPDEHALFCCRLTAELIHTGQYEAAPEALGYLWQGTGVRPQLKGLASLTTAEVLLQCGVLSGWLGSVHQISGAQEQAKDLLSESLRLFESQGQPSKVSEVQYELGICYWRAGAYDEARVILEEAFDKLGERDTELKAKISIRRASVEIWKGKYYEARQVLENTRPVFDYANDALRGKWHGQMGLVFRRLATAEGNVDYADRAIIEFTAAIYHYEQARHERYCATNLNNLAMLLYKLGRYDEAHENLDRAARWLTQLKDEGLLAQVNETRARVLVAEHRYKEANQIIGEVVETFERGNEYALLADALSIQGVVRARLGIFDSSLRVLQRAMDVAQDSGALSNAGLAALTLIEEHGTTRLSDNELYHVYRRSDELLKDTQDAEEIARLRACARIVTRRLLGVKLSDKNFSLTKAVRDYEARFVEEALEIEEGSVSRAAKRLGIKHQSLAYLLSARQQPLLDKRTPPVPRRRSIIKKPKTA